MLRVLMQRARALLAVSVIFPLAGCLPHTTDRVPDPPQPREPGPAPGVSREAAVRGRCLDHHPERRALFGDVHIHSAWSMDGWTIDVRATPDDAYRFARGGSLTLPGGRGAQLERPLDFAAVSDHAEFLGEVSLCTQPDSEV